MKTVAKDEPTEIAQAALDTATGVPAEERKPITKGEAEAVLSRFRLIDLLNLVVESARRASDRMSLTVTSEGPGVRVVVRVTHPRQKKGSRFPTPADSEVVGDPGLAARGKGTRA